MKASKGNGNYNSSHIEGGIFLVEAAAETFFPLTCTRIVWTSLVGTLSVKFDEFYKSRYHIDINQKYHGLAGYLQYEICFTIKNIIQCKKIAGYHNDSCYCIHDDD